jgi:hypothetical protein
MNKRMSLQEFLAREELRRKAAYLEYHKFLRLRYNLG